MSFDIGTEKIQYFGYMLISPSRDVVVSLFCDSYYKSVRLGGFKFVENHYLNGGVTPRILKKIQNENTNASEYIFLLTNFSLFYHYTHCAWKRHMYSLAPIYIRGCKCTAGVKCLWECELIRGPLPWVLFYIPLMWNVCAMKVMKHESTDNSEDIL